MDFHLAYALLVSVWCLRLMAVNDRLRRRDPLERAWRQLERQTHPSRAPRSLPR